MERFGSHGLASDAFAYTLLLHPDPEECAYGAVATMPAGYSYRGDVFFYPCSVIKVFYLVAIQAALHAGRLSHTAELERAMHDMIKWSSNTATNYIIDHLTDTTGDTELDDDAMQRWAALPAAASTHISSL